jgi:hypothetical protein
MMASELMIKFVNIFLIVKLIRNLQFLHKWVAI